MYSEVARHFGVFGSEVNRWREMLRGRNRDNGGVAQTGGPRNVEEGP